MVVLAAVAGVMAYLSVVANESKQQAVTSATRAQEARALAEERLTQSLIAQGRRELADNRAFSALAYFRAALERGADTRALRQMISIANRGRAAERRVTIGHGIGSLIGSPNGWFASGDETGALHYFKPDGSSAGELVAGQPFTTDLRRTADDGLLVAGAEAVLVIDAQHHITHTVKTRAQPWTSTLGPGADELTTIERDGFHVYGFDGTLRHTLPGPPEQTDGIPALAPDGKHAAYMFAGTVTVVDLVTGAAKTLATDGRNELATTPDGARFAYIDRADRVHVVATDGREVAVVKPEIRPQQVALAADGERFAAVSDREIEVFDGKGTSLSTFSIEREQYMFALRGSDVWTAGNDGNVHHYMHGALVADRPTHITPVRALVLVGDAIASLSEDSSLVIARADEQELVLSPDVCAHPSFGPTGPLDAYTCPGEPIRLYLGRELLAELPADRELMAGEHDDASDRTVIQDQTGVTVFDRERKTIAHRDADPAHRLGGPGWLDADHVAISEDGIGVWRWTLSTNQLEKVLDLPGTYGALPIPGGFLIGTKDNKLLRVIGGKVVHTAEMRERVEYFGSSPDHHWALAQLTNGGVAIIDATIGEVTRQLEPAEQSGGVPVFDATGDLILRLSRSQLTVWDRQSGDEIIFNFRLLDGMMGGRFLPDGRIEAASRSPALLDIPLDTRPSASIIRELACRVPLVATGGRLEPSTPKCD
jgi:hypothetical protein